MRKFFVFAIFAIFFVDLSVELSPHLDCHIKQMAHEPKKQYLACMGIPYAQPPIGELRFMPPVQIQGFNYSLSYLFPKPYCYALDTKGSEDCLYLNIYIPLETKITTKPVIVWVPLRSYSRSFEEAQYIGPDYLVDEDMIFVTVQFRVGFLGFASNLDQEMSGNWGLKDIRAALIWIQENIKEFGGDPKKVTLMGHEAGAALVSILQLSPSCEGLFSGVIMASGTSLMPSSRATFSKDFYNEMVAELKLQNTTNSTMIPEKLREMNASTILDASSRVYQKLSHKYNPLWGSLIGPVPELKSEHAIFTEKAHEALSKGNFVKVPSLIGFSSTLAFYHNVVHYKRLLQKMTFEQFCPVAIATKTKDPKAIGDIVRKYYWPNGNMKNITDIMEYVIDIGFKIPIIKTAQLMAQHTKVFLYEFAKTEYPLNLSISEYRFGQELAYIFKKFAPYSEVPFEDPTRQNIVNYFTNFAKKRDPLPNKQNFSWYPMNFLKNVTLYNRIDEAASLAFNPGEASIKFFDKLYQNYTDTIDVY